MAKNGAFGQNNSLNSCSTNHKNFLSQNRIENLVDIILGRFPMNKTQK